MTIADTTYHDLSRTLTATRSRLGPHAAVAPARPAPATLTPPCAAHGDQDGDAAWFRRSSFPCATWERMLDRVAVR